MADMRDELRVHVGREAAGDLVELAVLGQQRQRGALLRARGGAVGHVLRHLVVFDGVGLHVLCVTDLIDNLALDSLGRGERRRPEGDHEGGNDASSEHLGHAELLWIKTRKRLLISVLLRGCQRVMCLSTSAAHDRIVRPYTPTAYEETSARRRPDAWGV